MITRRTLLATLATTALLQGTSFAYAGNPVQVELIALGHWPVQKSLEPARDLLKTYGNKVVVQEMDAEADDGKAFLARVGLKGHVPLLIVINGAWKFPRPDGSIIEFMSFPSGEANPLGAEGSWSVEDLQYVLNNLTGG